MRNRNIRYQLWLNEKEADRLDNLVRRSGLPREVYLRSVINGLMPVDAPPPDYFTMMKELHYIGVNLNQISRKAHTLNVLDVKRLDEAVAWHNKAVLEITNAVMLPRKIERGTENE